MIIMDSYITGNTIKKLRIMKGLTQSRLAEQISVSSKTVSKWETGHGLPDISMIEPLSKALGVCVPELFSGDITRNRNVSANILKTRFHVCPICRNIITSIGEAYISCCGVKLPALEADECDDSHCFCIEPTEDEIFVAINHEMTKTHYILFLAMVTTDKIEMVKLYPEGNAQARFKRRGSGLLLGCCNKYGLFKQRIGR